MLQAVLALGGTQDVHMGQLSQHRLSYGLIVSSPLFVYLTRRDHIRQPVRAIGTGVATSCFGSPRQSDRRSLDLCSPRARHLRYGGVLLLQASPWWRIVATTEMIETPQPASERK